MRNGEVVRELLGEIRTCAGQLPPQLSAPLLAAVQASERTSGWLLENGRTRPRDTMAGATPFLRLLATTVGGWLMARQYLAVEGSDDVARRATAEFFLTQLVPQATALEAQVTAGVGVLDAVSDALLAGR